MRRLFRLVTALLGVAALGLLGLWWNARPQTPGAFYTVEAPSGPPGTLIRHEPLTSLPPGTIGFRMLYTSTRPDGIATAASAVVIAPDGPGAFPVIGWAHGTTGIRPGCAPSLSAEPVPPMPVFPAGFGAGWALVAPDYAGLGTAGPHFYLVGEDAARSMLDALRAARHLPGLSLAPETVVWGHSQGGHAALWTGQLAPAYAPEIDLRGIAALAPASDLPALAAHSETTLFGRIVLSYLIDGYSAAYPDLEGWSRLGLPERWLMRDLAGRCLDGTALYVSALMARFLPKDGLFRQKLTEGDFGERLAQNVPRGPFAAPVLIAQGDRDDTVLPEMQRGYVGDLCADGQVLDYREYTGRDHVSLVAADAPLVPALRDWTADRLAGRPVPAACP